MKGSICLVTGATSGLGLETARALAEAGATVILVGRSEKRLAAAREMVVIPSGNWDVHLELCDLSSFADVRALAERVKADFDRLDVLVNNAGGLIPERELTQDGHEMTFQVNHLGHFLLTHELLALLQQSPDARIVNVSSGAHRFGKIRWDDPTYDQAYEGIRAYCDAKLANILFTTELARRLEGTYIRTNACHPGPVATNFGGDSDYWFSQVTRVLRPVMLKPEQGARTQIWLATSSDAAGHSGKYFVDRKAQKPSRRARCPKSAARLWEMSEQATGVSWS